MLKKILIILATYNGETYLEQQLESIVAQKDIDWKMLISDDGSTDNTMAILHRYQYQFGKEKISIIQGPKQGFSKNFLYLIDNAKPDFDYYAFSDQDDIWYENKLFQAIEILETQDKAQPCLYGGRTKLIDENNIFIGFSPLFKKRPSFQNALVQSIAGGNTMVFNHASLKLLKRVVYSKNVISHDWWLYLFIAGCGGYLFYDKNPYISYRQHQNNLIGSNNGLFQKLKRFKLMLKGQFKTWNDSNIDNLICNKQFLTQENKKILDNFVYLRNTTMIRKTIAIFQQKFYRHTFFGNLGLIVGLVLNKV